MKVIDVWDQLANIEKLIGAFWTIQITFQFHSPVHYFTAVHSTAVASSLSSVRPMRGLGGQ